MNYLVVSDAKAPQSLTIEAQPAHAAMRLFPEFRPTRIGSPDSVRPFDLHNFMHHNGTYNAFLDLIQYAILANAIFKPSNLLLTTAVWISEADCTIALLICFGAPPALAERADIGAAAILLQHCQLRANYAA